MKFDAAVEFVRVRILNLSPTTVERKRDDALFNEILKYRYSRSKGIASTLRLKFRRWSMGKVEREVIVDHVLRTVSIRGGVRQPHLRLTVPLPGCAILRAVQSMEPRHYRHSHFVGKAWRSVQECVSDESRGSRKQATRLASSVYRSDLEEMFYSSSISLVGENHKGQVSLFGLRPAVCMIVTCTQSWCN